MKINEYYQRLLDHIERHELIYGFYTATILSSSVVLMLIFKEGTWDHKLEPQIKQLKATVDNQKYMDSIIVNEDTLTLRNAIKEEMHKIDSLQEIINIDTPIMKKDHDKYFDYSSIGFSIGMGTFYLLHKATKKKSKRNSNN